MNLQQMIKLKSETRKQSAHTMNKGNSFNYFYSLLLLLFYVRLISGSPNLDYSVPITRIAFGSCNQYDEDQSIWKAIVDYKPQLWIWTGDASYNDDKKYFIVDYPATIDQMKERYQKVKESADYNKLLQISPITGIWDDHDYGKNDGDNRFPIRKESQQEFLRFLDEPSTSIRWKREGIYTSFNIGPPDKRIKLILLDTRYFRTPEESSLEGGDILGEVQWKWLEEELTQSDAQFHLIFSGIQIIPNDKPIREKWANYPESRKRFFNLLEKVKPRGVVLFSGDIHYTEINRKECVGLGYPLIEFTSSGLTHCCEDDLPFVCDILLSSIWKSQYQVGYYKFLNFGTIEIDWKEDPQITLQAHDVNGTVVLSSSFKAGKPSQEGCQVEDSVPLWMLQPKKVLLKTIIKLGLQIAIPIILVFVLLYIFYKRQSQKLKKK